MDAARDRELALLLVQAQQGRQDAYEKFLLEVSVLLRAHLARRMPEGELVEDVLQETLLTIHRARQSYLPGRPVGPWLYAICEHRMIDFFRRHRRIARREVTAPERSLEHSDEPQGPVDNHPRWRVLEALATLPGRQRHVIELLKLQELSVKEVAARIGMSESAVKVTAFRGYQTIRKMLGVKSK